MLPADCAREFDAVRVLASGGYGTVVLAVQRALGRSVVIKTLHGNTLTDDDARRRFVGEAKVTAAIVHPNVVVVHAFGADAGVPWIAYEFMSGGSLRDRLRRGPVPWPEAVAIAAQCAAGLAAAHERGVLHRDVKPENLLASEARSWKVADFGIARWAGLSVKTEAGTMLGTPAYFAPEAISTEAEPRSDLYALGVMLHEMIAGRLPFQAASPVDFLNLHLRAQPPRLTGVPERVADFVLRLLAKNPDRRPADAFTAQRALEALAQSEPRSDATTVVAPVPGRRRAPVAVVVVALAFAAWSQRPPRAPPTATESAVQATPSPEASRSRSPAEPADADIKGVRFHRLLLALSHPDEKTRIAEFDQARAMSRAMRGRMGRLPPLDRRSPARELLERVRVRIYACEWPLALKEVAWDLPAEELPPGLALQEFVTAADEMETVIRAVAALDVASRRPMLPDLQQALQDLGLTWRKLHDLKVPGILAASQIMDRLAAAAENQQELSQLVKKQFMFRTKAN